ncbi:MAG: hypothetical protein ACM37W_00705 [Actinomycetota bacterium]
MQEPQNHELFTELTPEESANINGAYSPCDYNLNRYDDFNERPYRYQHYMYYPRRERSYRTVVVMRYQ